MIAAGCNSALALGALRTFEHRLGDPAEESTEGRTFRFLQRLPGVTADRVDQRLRDHAVMGGLGPVARRKSSPRPG